MADFLPMEQFTEKHADKFKPSQIKWLSRFRHSNGLAASGALVIVSRRMYINESKFAAWFAAQTV